MPISRIGTDGIENGSIIPADLSTGAPSWDGSGNLSFNSGYGSVATAYGCRAWVNFNGTGTVAIRASGNVTSITDNGTGDYTVNFTTAMPDANYATVATCGQAGNGMIAYRPTGNALTTTAARFNGVSTANALTDMTEFHVAIFR